MAGCSLAVGAVLLASLPTLAGGSIFKSHKTRTYNPDGVSAIGVYVCGSLECPPVKIVEGDCDTVPNATRKYGVCVCNEGYIANGEKCKSQCEVSPIDHCTTCVSKDSGPICTACEEDYLLENNQCVPCPEKPYCPPDNECCTLTGPEDICGRPTPVLGFKTAGGVCAPCSASGRVPVASLEACLTCNVFDSLRSISYAQGPLWCYSCLDPSGFFTTAELCAICGDLRTYNTETGECVRAS